MMCSLWSIPPKALVRMDRVSPVVPVQRHVKERNVSLPEESREDRVGHHMSGPDSLTHRLIDSLTDSQID